MSLQRHDVEKIAHLARLALDEQQIPEYASELSAILELVEQLSEDRLRSLVYVLLGTEHLEDMSLLRGLQPSWRAWPNSPWPR